MNSVIVTETNCNVVEVTTQGPQGPPGPQGPVGPPGPANIPQNSQSGNYTLALADDGGQVLHPNGAGAGNTFTIPANASVAFPIGAVVTFVNLDSNTLSIAITSDTLYLANSVTTGTRTLAQNSMATALKVAATIWLITGIGLT